MALLVFMATVNISKEALLGTSFIGDAVVEACARATLGGVSRRLWAVKYLWPNFDHSLFECLQEL